MTKTNEMTDASKSLFTAIVKAMGDWNGTPPTYEVGVTAETRGNLTDLKKRGLVRTTRDEGIDWIVVTELGREYARSIGLGSSLV